MPIEVEGETPGAGSAEPAPTTIEATAEEDEPEPIVTVPIATPASESKPSEPKQPAPTASPYATVAQSSAPASGGRRRRPTSLRDEEHVANVPRRPLSPPPFQPAAAPRSPAQGAPDTTPATAGSSGSLPEKLVALTKERPEVGLGLAFLGGLVLATIVKRLGRR